jgi:hypothetical protein
MSIFCIILLAEKLTGLQGAVYTVARRRLSLPHVYP